MPIPIKSTMLKGEILILGQKLEVENAELKAGCSDCQKKNAELTQKYNTAVTANKTLLRSCAELKDSNATLTKNVTYLETVDAQRKIDISSANLKVVNADIKSREIRIGIVGMCILSFISIAIGFAVALTG